MVSFGAIHSGRLGWRLTSPQLQISLPKYISMNVALDSLPLIFPRKIAVGSLSANDLRSLTKMKCRTLSSFMTTEKSLLQFSGRLLTMDGHGGT